MKVLHIEAGKSLFGGAKQVVYLMNGLAKHNIENMLVCPTGSDIASEVGAFNSPLMQVQATKMTGDLDIGFIFRLRTILKTWQPDVVLCHSRRGADVFGLIAAKLCKIPVICVRRVDNTEAHWLAKLKYEAFSKTVCISKAIENVLLEQGVAPEACEVIRSVIDTNEYTPQAPNTYLQKEFGFTEQNLVIGCFAQLIERKGQANLLRAFKQVHAQFPNSRLLICGKGKKRQEYEALCHKLGLQDAVVFAGFRTDVANLLPQLDVLAHPAFTEGLGVTLMQASACGLPIVATKAGGIPEVVINNLNGLLIPIDDEASLIESLNALLGSKEQRETYAKNGREFVLNNCSIDSMVNGYLALFKHLAISR